MPDGYLAVKRLAEAEFTEKRSRFIGAVMPADTLPEVEAFLDSVRKTHRDARHNVFAYRLLTGAKRCSDDGEPQGTGGMPVLNVLEKAQVTNAVLVVTRYFGGVLLGAGGLVRAYSHTAHLALEKAGIAVMEKQALVRVETDYAFHGKLEAFAENFGAKITDTRFTERVTVFFVMPLADFAPFCAQLFDFSAGKVKAEKIGEKFAEK